MKIISIFFQQISLLSRTAESFERWVTLHSVLLEGCLSRLQNAMDVAYLHTPVFVSMAHEAATAYQKVGLPLCAKLSEKNFVLNYQYRKLFCI